MFFKCKFAFRRLPTVQPPTPLLLLELPYCSYVVLFKSVEPNGELGFSMVFQSKATPFKRWVEPERIEKYVSFFGPGLDAEVSKKVDR